MWVRFPPGTEQDAPSDIGNGMIARRVGSIDLGAPAPRPFGLRPCCTAPAGSIPVGDNSSNPGHEDPAELPQVLGAHWWFHFGEALCEVIMPSDFYKVGPEDDLRWDSLGLDAYARDCAAWPGTPSDDLMHQSQFTLFRDIGGHLFGLHSREALEFAMNRVALREPTALNAPEAQLTLNLNRWVTSANKLSAEHRQQVASR